MFSVIQLNQIVNSDLQREHMINLNQEFIKKTFRMCNNKIKQNRSRGVDNINYHTRSTLDLVAEQHFANLEHVGWMNGFVQKTFFWDGIQQLLSKTKHQK